MNDAAPTDIEDIGAAVSEGRPVRPARLYRIKLSDESLNFRTLDIPNAVPLGRQILAAAGYEPPDEYSLFAILPTGDFEDIRLDETFDLRVKGAERFVAFRSDREYRLTLNGHEVRWGKPAISGAALYALANVSDDQVVFLDTHGGENRLVQPGDLVDLTAPGVERFYTERIMTITIVNEDNGHEFKLHGCRRDTVAYMIDEMYKKIGVPHRPDDRLRCENGGGDVFVFSSLTLVQYVEAAHCKCLIWLFAGGTGGAACR
jgi:hypothetical protein